MTDACYEVPPRRLRCGTSFNAAGLPVCRCHLNRTYHTE